MRRGLAPKRQWKTRWRMFGSTGVNGGCRSAGTEFLGTALATMETAQYVGKVRRSNAKETDGRRGDARNTNRAGLAANPLSLCRFRRKTGRRLERGLQYQPARQLELALNNAATAESEYFHGSSPCKVPDSACALCLYLCPVR